jgi:hypothetical protein
LTRRILLRDDAKQLDVVDRGLLKDAPIEMVVADSTVSLPYDDDAAEPLIRFGRPRVKKGNGTRMWQCAAISRNGQILSPHRQKHR